MGFLCVDKINAFINNLIPFLAKLIHTAFWTHQYRTVKFLHVFIQSVYHSIKSPSFYLHVVDTFNDIYIHKLLANRWAWWRFIAQYK